MKHSIRIRFTAIFFGIVAVILLTTWGLNTWGLENFYRSEKIKNIENAYTEINNVVMKAIQNGTTIIGSGGEGETGGDDSENDGDAAASSGTEDASSQLKAILEEYSDKYNITIAIVDSTTNKALFSSERGSDFLLKKAQNYLFRQDSATVRKTLKKTDNYSIINSIDVKSVSSSIECLGYCKDNQTVVIMSTSVANLRESVALSNRFLAYVGLLSLIAGMLIVFFMTRQITKPILKLSSLSERMGKLDFNVRYDEKRQDEIGVLGGNMNIMADKLEETISELQKANAQLQADIKKKEEIDEMRKAFIANVSHELKTPIALIQGYAEGLNDGLCEDEESRKYYTDVIMDEAGKMNSMVKQLLTLSALESGTQEISTEQFDLTELINGVIHSTRILAGEKKAEIRFSRTEPLLVWGDEFKIEEVITNYVSNAIHHVNDGGSVEITAAESGERVRVNVFNTGSSIPEEDLPHIWDKFYKVDKAHSRAYGGTGIGLSIVQAIMEAHHMPYGAENKGNGVNFWFELSTKKD